MNKNDIDSIFHIRRILDHLLKPRTFIVGRGRPRFDKLLNEIATLKFTVFLHLPPLVGDRELFLSLFDC